MEKIKMKVLENMFVEFILNNFPELINEKEYFKEYPIDEYEDYDWTFGQDADIIDIAMICFDVADYFEKNVNTKNLKIIKKFFKVFDDMKIDENFSSNMPGYNLSLYTEFMGAIFYVIERHFDFIKIYMNDDLKKEYNLWQE